MDCSSIDLGLGPKLRDEVIAPLYREFVERNEILDLLGIALLAGENVFLLGPPGTAKSAIVRAVADRLAGRTFEYLLTRFTEPNELFGPFDLRKLREGELSTNTEGMLPEADIVFLDELLNANSAILNSLLSVLNERVLTRGRERFSLPTLSVVGASNRLPDDDALAALFDRFLLRARCAPVSGSSVDQLLEFGWKREQAARAEQPTASPVSCADLRKAQREVSQVDVSTVRADYAEAVLRLRHAGLDLSDRRAVRLQRAIAASAYWCGRSRAESTDLWVLKHVWESENQMPVLDGLIHDFIGVPSTPESIHPQAQSRLVPTARSLSESLVALEQDLADRAVTALARAKWHEQAAQLGSQIEWISDGTAREELRTRLNKIWDRLTTKRQSSEPPDSA